MLHHGVFQFKAFTLVDIKLKNKIIEEVLASSQEGTKHTVMAKFIKQVLLVSFSKA